MDSPPIYLNMRSTDLIKKEPLDYGGFGEVYLCYHKTLGQVVLKRVYTGSLRNESSRQSLQEEGSLMTQLNHKRVVKLLGVIMEDGDYSLVMELIPKGNLFVMLQQVSVPMSIKGRIILEILEGMIYLTLNGITHKDLKPDNILVDKDFHIKIADLGLATCQKWRKLTQEESRRQSTHGRSSGARAAGTLCYMAPEHLESIHTRFSEKSDVYSLAIVVWVVLSGQEPYENAVNETQVSQCVRNGDRPDVDLIPLDTPIGLTELMQYEGPKELVDKMRSLSMDPDCTSQAAPLLSTDSGPVEASVEDLGCQPLRPSLQMDARTPSSPLTVEHKLDQELLYHKHGSYTEPQGRPEPLRRPHSEELYQPARDISFPASSVLSWTKGEPVHSSSKEEATLFRPGYGSVVSSESPRSMDSQQPSSHIPMSASFPSLGLNPSHHPYARQPSWPFTPVMDTGAHDLAGLHSGKFGIQRDPEDHAVTEEHLELLRDNIGSTWKRCARRLGLTETEVEVIEHDHHPYGLSEKVHQMLECWKMKNGLLSCTLGKLCRGLLGVVKVDVITSLLELHS
ncbi:receptor-interacting serine/threonine-protein kinase 1 [Aplochiton taeniatus]